jgi:hypothetical protein
VPILYHPDDPTQARLARGFTGAAPTLTGVLMLIIGILFAVVGAGVFVALQAVDLP